MRYVAPLLQWTSSSGACEAAVNKADEKEGTGKMEQVKIGKERIIGVGKANPAKSNQNDDATTCSVTWLRTVSHNTLCL